MLTMPLFLGSRAWFCCFLLCALRQDTQPLELHSIHLSSDVRTPLLLGTWEGWVKSCDYQATV